MENEQDQLLEISKRLGVVIALLLKALPRENSAISLRDQVQTLSELGSPTKGHRRNSWPHSDIHRQGINEPPKEEGEVTGWTAKSSVNRYPEN